MAAINVIKKDTGSVTLEYRGTEMRFVVDVRNKPIPVSNGSFYRILQGWEQRDLIARAAAILTAQKKRAKQ